MINEELRKKINEDEGYTTSLFYTNQSYDNSVIGVDVNGKVVYDYDKMVEEYVSDEFPDLNQDDYQVDEAYTEAYTEAMEWIDYNTIRATPYASSFGIPPVIIDKNEESDDENDYYNLITGEPYNYNDIVYKVNSK